MRFSRAGRDAIPSVVVLLVALVSRPHPATAEDWWRVESPHFVVLSDAGEKQALRTARELESIRAVFSRALPNLSPPSGPPLVAFAASNGKSFERLLPRRGGSSRRSQPGGLYVRTSHESFLLLDTKARGAAPYSIVYHEYFHSLLLPALPGAPLWFHEGLASLWESTVFRSHRVEMARPSEAYLSILRSGSWISLRELVAVDRASLHEGDDRNNTLFYAESWALVHYILLGEENRQRRGRLERALTDVKNGADAKVVFSTALGDLEELEGELRNYVRKIRFTALRMDLPPVVDDRELSSAHLEPQDSGALLARYFALIGNREAAKERAEAALRLDPRSATAHEAMGLLEYADGRTSEAAASFERALAGDGTSALPDFFLALLVSEDLPPEERLPRVQQRLERAVARNPWHGPSLARLAMLYHAISEKRALGLALAERAAVLLRDDPFAQTAYGIALRDRGRLEEAIRAFERALELAPDFELAKGELEDATRAKQR